MAHYPEKSVFDRLREQIDELEGQVTGQRKIEDPAGLYALAKARSISVVADQVMTLGLTNPFPVDPTVTTVTLDGPHCHNPVRVWLSRSPGHMG